MCCEWSAEDPTAAFSRVKRNIRLQTQLSKASEAECTLRSSQVRRYPMFHFAAGEVRLLSSKSLGVPTLTFFFVPGYWLSVLAQTNLRNLQCIDVMPQTVYM